MNLRRIASLGLLLGLIGCAAPLPDGLHQVSLIDALLAGDYDGHVTIGELRELGDFGIGTFDKLDGEMIVINGAVYRAASDGTVQRVDDDQTTPFAAVTRFETDHWLDLDDAADLDALGEVIDAALGNTNVFYALRVEAVLPTVTLRSVPAQSPPYKPLAEVVANQSVWEHEGLAGTLVGLRCPAYSKGINVPGYHWHFISHNRRIGGHVLAATLPQQGVTVRVDRLTDWSVRLPEGDGFGTLDLDADRTAALHKVEH